MCDAAICIQLYVCVHACMRARERVCMCVCLRVRACVVCVFTYTSYGYFFSHLMS